MASSQWKRKGEDQGTSTDQQLEKYGTRLTKHDNMQCSNFSTFGRDKTTKIWVQKMVTKVQKNVVVWYISMSVYFTKLSAFSKRNYVVPSIEDEMNGLNQGGNGMAEQCTCNALQCRRKMSFSTALQLLQHFKTKNCDKISLYMRKYLKRK